MPGEMFPKIVRVNADRVLGIGCTLHGASIAYMDRGGTVRASVLDRFVGVKNTLLFSRDEDHDIRFGDQPLDVGIRDSTALVFGGFPPTRVFEDVFPAWFEWLVRGLGVTPADIDLVVWSPSHFVTSRLGDSMDRWFPNAKFAGYVEHHQVHQAQAFWQSGFEEAAVVTVDSSGEHLDRLGGRKVGGTILTMNRDGERITHREFLHPEMSSGGIYAMFNYFVGFRQNDEGKTMGLAPFGRAAMFDKLRPYLELHDDGGFKFIHELRQFWDMLEAHVPRRKNKKEMPILPEHEDVAFAGQALIELIVTNTFRAAMKLTGKQDLAVAGGVGLNCVANDKAFKAVRPRRMYVAPNAGDTGQGLGCAMFGAYEIAKWKPPERELPEFLGPPYTPEQIEMAVMGSEVHRTRPDDIAGDVARCIMNGHIIGRFDGGAEYGPRALGNRSLLTDPRRADMRDYLNSRVKFRERFRPFAPSVLAEKASEWFDMDEPSPSMLRAVPCRPDRADKIPSALHIDGTGRVQTVAPGDNDRFRDILEAFDRLTGVPIVVNTSFNLGGKPIVETPQDAVECFKATLIDILAIGPWILSKEPLDHYLTRAR